MTGAGRVMRSLFLIFAFVSISGCASLQDYDNRYSQEIDGSWFLQDHGYKDSYTTSLIAFTVGGRKCVIGTDYNLYQSGKTETTYWDNEWTVKDGYLITTITKSSGRYTKTGDKIRDKILLLKSNMLNVLMETESDYVPSLERHIRLVDEDPSRICEVIDHHFGND